MASRAASPEPGRVPATAPMLAPGTALAAKNGANGDHSLRANLLALTPEDWRLSIAIKTDATVHPCQAAQPHGIAAGGGACVNTASQRRLCPAPNHSAGKVSKAAVAGFSQIPDRACAPRKVRVHAVCPGDMHTPTPEAGAKRQGCTIADLDKTVLYGRIGKPEEVAAPVAVPASHEAAFICGSLVEITGAPAVAQRLPHLAPALPNPSPGARHDPEKPTI